jgi:hypothetical protein
MTFSNLVMAGLLGKKWGFERSVRKAPVFYGLVALGTLGGTVLSLLHVNPISLLVFVAVINGLAAARILGWLTATIMAAAAIALLATVA